jgi:hypothetical protein
MNYVSSTAVCILYYSYLNPKFEETCVINTKNPKSRRT